MRSLDPLRDDAGVRLRTLRLRRGLSQVALADLACISPGQALRRGLTVVTANTGQPASAAAVRLEPPVHSSTVPVMKLAPAR